jgi:hypothetical protein
MRILTAAVLLAFAAGPALAQQAPAPGQPRSILNLVTSIPDDVLGASTHIAGELQKVSAAMVDLSVPDSPAFTVLGLTPEEVARPTTARKLATSLLNGFDRNGTLQTGIAIDALPYLALAGHLLTLDDYRSRSKYVLRFLARTQVSVATAKAGDVNDKAVRVGLGVRMMVFDRGDPRTDPLLDQCFDQRPGLPSAPLFVPPAPLDPTATPEEVAQFVAAVDRAREEERRFQANVDSYVARVTVAVADCREAARKRNWNASKWIVAVAPTWTSATGAGGNLGPSGTGIWTTLVYGFEQVPGLQNNAQLLIHVRRRDGEPVAGASDPKTWELRDSRLLGFQLRAGTVNSSIAFEGLDERITPAVGASRTDRRFSIGYERRLAENLWLGVALGNGKKPAATGQAKSGFVLSSLKWGFAEGPSLRMP